MDDDRVTSYLPYLPAVLRQSSFLGRFLLAFETVLTGVEESTIPDNPELAQFRQLAGFEQLLNKIDRFFDPALTDSEFLPWLAQWVATSLRDDWSEDTKRKFIAGIVPLYRQRGTRAGIQAVLQLSGEDAVVVDFHDGEDDDYKELHFGTETKPPFFFGVVVTIANRDPVELARRTRRVRAIVDQEKPAHTYYGLRILYPAMRINNEKTNTDFGPGITISSTDPLVLGTTKA